MPKVSGTSLISDTTEKIIRRLVVTSAITTLVKLYNVPLTDLKLLGVELPSGLFDVVALFLISYLLYSFLVSWGGDLAAFRLWFQENNMLSNFGTQMKLDKSFLSGGVKLLDRLYHLEKSQEWPSKFELLPQEVKEDYQDYKTNVELYIARLGAVGQRFGALSIFGRFYVWIQSFLLPLIITAIAFYALIKYGNFSLPERF